MLNFAMLDEKVEPSLVPAGDDSHAEVKVALGLRMDLNCICNSHFMRGTASKEWNRSSTAKPMPSPSDMGIGPCGGIVGVFLNCWQLRTVLRMTAACASIIATALPPIASRFAQRRNMM
jgi:hypothetical protein